VRTAVMLWLEGGTLTVANYAESLTAVSLRFSTIVSTLAVAGTVFLGCALEGALLLVLFSSAAFVEMRLTGHARGDLRSLWATVPGEAVLVDVDAQTRAPVAATEQVIPARDVPVGAHVYVRSGQQVRAFFRFFSLFFRNAKKTSRRSDADDDTFAETS